MKSIFYILLFIGTAGFLPAQCPHIAGCPGNAVDVCDYTPNDDQLWNNTDWWDPLTARHNLADAPMALSINATDTCLSGALDVRYLLFLDLDGNGTRETVIDSDNLPPANTVPYDNYANPNYSGGTPRAFDQRPVPADQQYRFALEISGTPADKTAKLRWNTTAAPGTYVDPQLPYGNHRIQWIARNGAGEADTCAYDLVVKDCKKPTVVCLNGLSVNIMPTQMVTLWASDFLQYVEDNYSPSPNLVIAIRKVGTGTGFPVNPDGSPTQSVTFNCTELGTQLVELWCRDQVGNADYCEVYTLVQDNMGNCQGNPTYAYIDATVCARLWSNNAVVSGVGFGLSNGAPFSIYTELDPNGCLELKSGTIPANFTITPTKDGDPLNGVSTLDLIRIHKHILGIEPMASPYGMIAADANNSRSVTTFDVVEFRKLLQGIYTELPNSNAWRFVDANYVFTNPNNPFQGVFPETKQIASVTDSILGNFVFKAIKVGDVDGDALPGFKGSAEPRSLSLLRLPDQVLQAGTVVDLPVYAAADEQWLGLQLGLDFDADLLSVESVLPGALPNWDAETAVQPEPGHLRVVWYDARARTVGPDAPLFTLRLRALAPLRLRDALRLERGGLRAEAYDAAGAPRDLSLYFDASRAGDTGIGEPYPNPTNGGATVAVQLQAECPVAVTVLDMQGRQTWQVQAVLPQGEHQVELPAAAFPAPGMYFWQVRAGEQVQSGKLVKW